MTDYINSYGGAAKDTAAATIKGAELDTEFNGIATMSATKTNKAVPAVTNNVALLSSTGDLVDSGYQSESKNNAPGRRGALVYKSAVQAIPHNTATIISFDSEEYDTNSIHDNVTNNTRLTVPAGVTKVKIHGGATFEFSTYTYTYSEILKNGGANYVGIQHLHVFSDGATSTNCYNSPVSPILSVTGGDYFELRVIQVNGAVAARNANGGITGCWFAMEIIE